MFARRWRNGQGAGRLAEQHEGHNPYAPPESPGPGLTPAERSSCYSQVPMEGMDHKLQWHFNRHSTGAQR